MASEMCVWHLWRMLTVVSLSMSAVFCKLICVEVPPPAVCRVASVQAPDVGGVFRRGGSVRWCGTPVGRQADGGPIEADGRPREQGGRYSLCSVTHLHTRPAAALNGNVTKSDNNLMLGIQV